MKYPTAFGAVAGVRCWHCGKPHDFARCSACGSYRGETILGYRFHWLWRGCKRESTRRDCERHDDHYHGETRYLACEYCPGTGYVLIEHDRTDALLRVVRSQGWSVRFGRQVITIQGPGVGRIASGKTLDQALMGAMGISDA